MVDGRLDIQLIQATKTGDSKAFEVLVRRYQPRIVRIVSRFIQDPQEGLDICQEIFLRIYKALDQFRGDSSFYTWLYRIAINTSKNHKFLKENNLSYLDLEAHEIDYFLDKQFHKDQASPENFLIRDEVEQLIYNTIDQLPVDLKKALVLREMEGKSYEEIATIMACPIGTVRSRLFRARTVIDKNIQSLL